MSKDNDQHQIFLINGQLKDALVKITIAEADVTDEEVIKALGEARASVVKAMRRLGPGVRPQGVTHR